MISGSEVEHSILLAGLQRLRSRRAHGVLAARSQRDRSAAGSASRARTGSWSATTPTSRSGPVRGCSSPAPPGCSGSTSLRAGERAGYELVRGRRGPSSTSPTRRRRASGRSRASRPSAVLNCAAWTDVDGAESHARAGARRQRRRRREPRARRRAAAGVPLLHVSTDYVFDGVAPPRPHGRAASVCRVRSDRAALGLRRRRKLAGERAGARRLAAPHRRAQRVAVRHRRARTSPRRCSRSRASAMRCRWSPTRSAARRGPATSRLRCSACWSASVSGLVHLAGAGHDLVERVRRGDLPPGRGRLPRRGGDARRDMRVRRHARRGRRSSPSARTCCRCPRGRTASPAISRRALG